MVIISVSPADLQIVRFRKVYNLRQKTFRDVGLSDDDGRMPAVIDDENSPGFLALSAKLQVGD